MKCVTFSFQNVVNEKYVILYVKLDNLGFDLYVIHYKRTFIYYNLGKRIRF